jgi:hypothetical protein
MVNCFNSAALGSQLAIVADEDDHYFLNRLPERRSYKPQSVNMARLHYFVAQEWLRAVRCGFIAESDIPALVRNDEAYQLTKAAKYYEALLDNEADEAAAPKVTVAVELDEVLLILTPTIGRALSASHIMRFNDFSGASTALAEIAKLRWSPFTIGRPQPVI